MTPDPISDEARKCWDEVHAVSKQSNYLENMEVTVIQRHMTAYAKQAVAKALAEVKCYNCGELAVRL